MKKGKDTFAAPPPLRSLREIVGHHAKDAKGGGSARDLFFGHDAEKYTFADLLPLRTLRDARDAGEMRIRSDGLCASFHRSVPDN